MAVFFGKRAFVVQDEIINALDTRTMGFEDLVQFLSIGKTSWSIVA